MTPPPGARTIGPVERAAAAQRRAADPAVSVWVSANAGSGKTRVLTERVARLLLGGARPERILCLTYTRAAAAEMANRLADTLGRWALTPEPALRATLRRATGLRPETLDAARLAAARRLFAKALETPGGLRIQTIHAFCGDVLRRFPLEAGVSPAFSLLDDAAAAEIAARARDAVAEAAAAGRSDAFDEVAAILSDEGMDALIRAILRDRALFGRQTDPAAIARAFGLADAAALAERPVEALLAATDRARLDRAVAILSASGRNDRWIGVPLAQALALPPEAAAPLLAKALRAGDGPRDWSKAPTKALAAAHPWLRPFLAGLSEGFEAAAARANAIDAARRAIALGRFGAALVEAAEAEKRARGALDYDDLIAATNRLLCAGGPALWARFKLDEGVDHILVDEAQDTAPAQWGVIRALAEPFFDEPGAGGRTLFVVGDEKQSIYGFQGAEPALFGAMRDRFDARAQAAGAPFAVAPLLASFRSAAAILRVVDLTFRHAAEGLGAGAEPPLHRAARRDLAGRVDLWPLIEPGGEAAEPAWDAPLDAPPPEHPRIRLARLVAAEIARWIDEGERLPGGDRPIRPGDVMVLVRRRDALARTVVRELKRLGAPVAGADRLAIADELAVKDLLALARVALTPDDDLTLAALLRSPLCGLTEDDLFALAHGRAGSLWDALRAAGERFPEALGVIRRAMAAADFLRPYEFLEAALAEGGRRRLLARLGPQAEDAVDELLAQALAYESAGPPSLGGFLAWIARAGIEIRREQDRAAGEVRVMTVHGAKGLEAPVVILPDTLPATLRQGPRVVALDAGGGAVPAWPGAKDSLPPSLRAAEEVRRARERDESRRLLYVAMTRAERWLIVCGAGKPPKEESWHGLVAAALDAAAAATVPGPAGAAVRRVENEAAPDAPPVPSAVAPPPDAVAPPPAWIAEPAAPPARVARRRASALADDAAAPRAAGGAAAEAARLRGVAIHALLERLPAAAPEARPALAAAILAGLAPGTDAATRAALLAEATAAMAAEGAADFFAPDALAEAPLSLALPGGGRIAGRIDRLVLRPGLAAAVDFKTDARPPAGPAAVPEPYLRQMAAYRAALAALWPDRAPSLALLWTAEARLMPLPDAVLDGAWGRLLAEAG